MGLELVVETSQAVVIFAPLGLLDVDLGLRLRLRGLAATVPGTKDVVYLLVGGRELVRVEELLVGLLLVEELLALEHLLRLLDLLGAQVCHRPLSEVGLAVRQV